MKILTALLAIATFSFSAQALEINCTCIEGEKNKETDCKDIRFELTNQNPGTYLRTELNDGLKVIEGFATVTRNLNKAEIIYNLKDQTLIKRGSLFFTLDSNRRCLSN
jgi:hypothetical protein